jgi:signal transduction histidine kinase
VIVIVMTAYASLETAIEAMKFGAYDYLIKPFNDVEKVMNIVARAVERSQLARRNAQLLKDLQAANRRLKELFTESQERSAQLEAAYNELKERNLFKSQLVSNISHQLRTPLALVKGYVMLMVDRFLGGVTEEQAVALEMVSERTDNLIQVVDDLLFMQDIESGNAYLCLEAVSVPHLVRRVCRRMRPRIQRKTIILQVTIQEDEKTPIIQGDPLRLEQAFTHLLDNAIKFSAPGSCISVKVGVRDRHLYLSVHNQGHNILPENLVRPVDNLYQAALSPRQQAGDLGMGLLLVKHIAEMHGGDVVITSDPEAGTIVCLTLPLEDKGRLLHQSMALTSDSANQFRIALQTFSAPQPAWQTI